MCGGQNNMEFKIIKYLTRIAFVLLVMLIANHFLRGLNWLPLCILLIPAYGMLVFGEELEE